jgi:hypothetical protein
VRRCHRGSRQHRVGVGRVAAAHVHARSGDVGLDRPAVEGRRPPAGERRDVVVDVVRTHRVALRVRAGLPQRAAGRPLVARRPRGEDPRGDPRLDRGLVPGVRVVERDPPRVADDVGAEVRPRVLAPQVGRGQDPLARPQQRLVRAVAVGKGVGPRSTGPPGPRRSGSDRRRRRPSSPWCGCRGRTCHTALGGTPVQRVVVVVVVVERPVPQVAAVLVHQGGVVVLDPRVDVRHDDPVPPVVEPLPHVRGPHVREVPLHGVRAGDPYARRAVHDVSPANGAGSARRPTWRPRPSRWPHRPGPRGSRWRSRTAGTRPRVPAGRRRTSRCEESACAVSWFRTKAPRPVQLLIDGAALRSALLAITIQKLADPC